MRLLVATALACTLASVAALAEPPAIVRGAPAPLRLYAQERARMSPEERQQLREQLRSVDRDLYRGQRRGRGEEGERRAERTREPRAPPGARLTPQEREQLRRDIMNANRRFERR